ncbi:MAG: hypothetical protein QXJ97_12455, partial [Desulfurococcaceae archaeon]
IEPNRDSVEFTKQIEERALYRVKHLEVELAKPSSKSPGQVKQQIWGLSANRDDALRPDHLQRLSS